MKIYKKILLLFLVLVFADKAIAQNINKSAGQRVIYEQNTSYDDARQMKKNVEKIEKQKEAEGKGSDQLNPIIAAMNNDSGQNSEIADMLKILLNAMGIHDLPENIAEVQGLGTGAKSDQIGGNDFKTWEDRHNWKGIRSEQR